MNIHNGQDLVELCAASDVATFLTDLVKPIANADDSVEAAQHLATVTMSMNILCQKLKKLNSQFSFEFINDNEEWSSEH